ncbi:MAG: hypothetical protein U9O97_00770 [Elusimicrobiota bacterium]|nr:hypothetical protein [Elusimicrobiota bacterium]
MNVKDIERKLNELFKKDRVIFWNDADGEFEEVPGKSDLERVRIVRSDKICQLKHIR